MHGNPTFYRVLGCNWTRQSSDLEKTCSVSGGWEQGMGRWEAVGNHPHNKGNFRRRCCWEGHVTVWSSGKDGQTARLLYEGWRGLWADSWAQSWRKSPVTAEAPDKAHGAQAGTPWTPGNVEFDSSSTQHPTHREQPSRLPPRGSTQPCSGLPLDSRAT